ncbi:Vitamin B12 transporter BtuB [Sporomusa silvacetica DSM 10669]|uniref:Vitamin B12 transporter BtuB n=1 Tax=Sporomusa silvacetica DSM 10669 TaxID=1123289 RepID=A0ABZ3IVS2_9FIRM|nr:TonB-dependent receptor [Sporomusa silvacetica]OZC14279.1 vitamin B12 transporter BtuB [Sporomusa silvacetica DSM 10669]
MKKQVSAIIMAFAVISIPLTGLAEQSVKEESYDLTEVVVSAKKYKPETIEETDPAYNLFALPESSKATTQTFTREKIEAMHPKDVTEIIESGLGMYQYRWGNRGFFGAKSRGGDSLGIVVDGVYLPQSEASRIMYSFPVAMIESVTIVRDASALTLGPLATIGVKDTSIGSGSQGFIMIKTRKSTSKENEAKFSYGSFSTEKVSVFSGNKINDNAYFDFAYSKDRTSGQADRNNYSNFDSFMLKSGYQGKDYIYDMSVLYINGSRGAFFGLNEDGSIATKKAINYPSMNSLLVTWNAVKEWDKNHITGFNSSYGSVCSNIITGSTPQSEDEYFNQYNLFHTIKTGSNTLRIGGQAILWRTPTGVGGSASGSRKEELFGYYAYDEKRISDRWTLDGGVRVDNKHVIEGAKATFGVDGPFWESPAKSVAIGSTYKMNSVYSLSSRIAYTNQPTDSALTLVAGKTTLPAEERKKYEVGIDAKFSRKLNAALTAFYYDIQNGKYVSSTTGRGDTAINYYDAHDMIRKGMELSFEGQLSKTLGYQLGYSHFVSSYEVDDYGNPHDTYTLGLNYKKNEFDANINIRRVSRFYTREGTAAPYTYHALGKYTTADFNIGKMVDKNTKVTLFVRNLTDRKYPLGYVSGYFYDAGRSYGVEVTKKF